MIEVWIDDAPCVVSRAQYPTDGCRCDRCGRRWKPTPPDGSGFVRWVLGTTEIDSYLRSTDPDRLVTALTTLAPEALT